MPQIPCPQFPFLIHVTTTRMFSGSLFKRSFQPICRCQVILLNAANSCRTALLFTPRNNAGIFDDPPALFCFRSLEWNSSGGWLCRSVIAMTDEFCLQLSQIRSTRMVPARRKNGSPGNQHFIWWRRAEWPRFEHRRILNCPLFATAWQQLTKPANGKRLSVFRWLREF